MINLVVFDWNGTLLADTKACLDGVKHELAIFGMSPITINRYRETFEVPVERFFQNLGISKTARQQKYKQAAKAFHDYYEPRAAHCRTRAGTRAALDWLQKQKIRKVILSNHTSEGIYAQLGRLKLNQYFDAVLANDSISDSYHQGKLGRLKDYLIKNQLSPKQTLIVGDTAEEVLIGKELGINAVAISGGHYSTKRLVATKPDYLIHSLTELQTIAVS